MRSHYVDPNLFWAIYVGRESDEDYDLAAIMPATERTIACRVSEDFDEETLAYHLAHELTASLQYDGERAELISGPDARFPDVLSIGEGHTQPSPVVFETERWDIARYMN